MKTTNSEPDFSQLTGDSKRAFERMESARRSSNEIEVERAVATALAKLRREQRHSNGNPISRYFEANPEARFIWNGISRKLAGGGVQVKSLEHYANSKAVSGINMQDTFGAGTLLAIPVANEIYDLLLTYGSYKDLGLRKLVGQYTRYPKITAYPTAVFITPNQQGAATIPEDTSLAGIGVTPDANTIACLIRISREWLLDEKVDLAEIVLEKFVTGLAARIDYGCFQGNGADDTTNGMTKGLFIDNTIATSVAALGSAQVQKLNRSDFINALQQVAPAALQRMQVRSPRWYISPVLIPNLLQLYDTNAKAYLLHTPAQTGGDWQLVGFPVTWAAQAPGSNAPNAKIAAFGNPDAYLVALHEAFELSWSNKGPAFGQNSSQFRALGRGSSFLRESTGFVTLQLAPG